MTFCMLAGGQSIKKGTGAFLFLQIQALCQESCPKNIHNDGLWEFVYTHNSLLNPKPLIALF